MISIVDASEIEQKVGAKRHPTLHLGRWNTEEGQIYILHSQQCLDDPRGLLDSPKPKDLTGCYYSRALGVGVEDGFEPDLTVVLHARWFWADKLLSLGPLYQPTQMESAASTIAAAGYQAYRLSLMAGSAEYGRRYFERSSHPQAGDLVLESSTYYRKQRHNLGHEGLGTLLAKRYETVNYPREEGYPPEVYSEEIWEVEPYCGGDVVRWTNASFISIPRTAIEGSSWTEEG